MIKQALMLTLISCILFTLSYNGSALAQEWEWEDYALTDSSVTLYDVAYANGTYVAVGTHGTIFTSEDAATWNAIDPLTSRELRSIIYYQGKFYAAGYYGTILSSENGQDWSVVPTGTAYDFSAITSGPDKLVAVGKVVNWSIRATVPFVVVSNDGVTWTKRQLPTLATGLDIGYIGRLESITYGDGLYVAVGWEKTGLRDNPYSSVIATSHDGWNWYKQPVIPGVDCLSGDVTYGDGKYVILCSHNKTLLSEDGSSWQEVVTTNLPYISIAAKTVRYLEGTEGRLFVIAGRRVLSSPDGQTWTLRRDADSHDLISFGIAYGDGKVVTVGQSNDGTLGAFPAYAMVAPVDLGDPVNFGPNCGNGNCDTDEDCITCPLDCLSSQEVCCSGVSYTGDCCSHTDCDTGYACINHICIVPGTEFDAITETPEATGDASFTVNCTATSSMTTLRYDFQWSTDGSYWQDWVESSDSASHIFGDSGNPTSVDDGDTFHLRCRVNDGAGYTGEWSPVNSTLVDSSPPSCAMSSMDPYHNTTSLQITWSTPDTDAVSYDLCINRDDSACTAPSPLYTRLTTATQTLTGSNGNTYYISCRATDMTGNTGEWSPFVSTTIDTTPPSLDSSQYTAALTSSDSEELLVNITVSDEVGIDDVSLVIGTQEVSPTQKTGSSGDTEWTLEWEIPYGTYFASSAFTIVMEDVNGNSDSEDFSYSVSDCNAGDTRACNPLDSAGDAYTQGVCRGTGERTCQEDGSWSNCTGGTLPTAEDCNDLDDDCDGEVDEDLASQPCGPPSDLGICQYGTSSCSGGVWTTCIGAVYPKASETCGNDLDDDCNGVTDDGCVCKNTDPPISCGESNIGICKLGQSYCVDGTRGSCIGAIYSTTEMCGNTLDDDCDGLTDCDDSDCLGSYLCEVDPIPPEPFPWWWLSVIGAAILVVLVIVWYYFKSQGKEL